jgi:uncharacterized protein (DUF427 family)
MKASWKGVVIAQSDDTVLLEGNHYFPESIALDRRYVGSATTRPCAPGRGRRVITR